MSLTLAVMLWVWHAFLLLWNLRSFRPRFALLHGVGMALLAGLVIWLGPPAWVLYLLGAVVGAVAGRGHPFAPGLFVGVGLLWVVPFLAPSGYSVLGVTAVAVSAQLAAIVASLTRPTLAPPGANR